VLAAATGVGLAGLWAPAHGRRKTVVLVPGVWSHPRATTVSGWHYAGLWIPVLIVTAATSLAFMARGRRRLPFDDRPAVAWSCVLAGVIATIRLLSMPRSVVFGAESGPRWGAFLVLGAVLCAIGATVRAGRFRIPIR
jgi:hypothetical protein